MEPSPEPVPTTAAQIASEHFNRHLAASQDADTVVILHDACYGHRFSRPKTSKSTLNLIVERPERVLASVLGASAAYVQLGGHFTGGANAPGRAPTGRPPFAIRRTGRTMDVTESYVTNVHGTAWMAELQDMCNGAEGKLASGTIEVGRAEGDERQRLHEGDLYLSPGSLEAFRGALGGVAEAVDAVFTTPTKRAFVAIRPPGHHCSTDHPSGFCWLNNVHVGIEYAAQKYGLTHVAILDFDLHHGDGSQTIAWERNSANMKKRAARQKSRLAPDIAYYSLHDINSYPCESGDDEKVQAASLCIEYAHGQNIWNVHLQPWKTEEEFWQLYEGRYRIIIDKARIFLHQHNARGNKTPPRAAIFISAGFDASEWESSGMQRHKVNVPTSFYARFTRDVVGLAQEPASGCEGRVISVLEGGYSDRALCSGVMSHISGLVHGGFDEGWWSQASLEALEMKTTAVKPRAQYVQPTYASPTESFTHKVVDRDKFSQSMSRTFRDVYVPPSVDVDWVLATHELAKVLIPVDRTTKSCSAEELSRKKAVSAEALSRKMDAMNVETGPRQLRDRKAKSY
ncbi:Arginase/deacetylase, partial [Piedraia hortae CBS 480.64]